MVRWFAALALFPPASNRPGVIPGRAERREPGIHSHRLWLWIPGALATLAPRNDDGEVA